MRMKLSQKEEEKEKKRKLRNKQLFKKYRTYQGIPGSREVWSEGAQDILAMFQQDQISEDLKAMRLDKIPSNLATFKKMKKKALLKIHPDMGGSNEEMLAFIGAANRIERIIKK